MKDPVLRQAELLEDLLPEAMRTLFPGAEGEPLSELTVAQMRIVRMLAKGPSTVTAMADRLKTTLPGITQLLGKLESAGLVFKTTSAEDRRTRHVDLTDEARHLLLARKTTRAKRASQLLGQMTPEERDNLIATLTLLVQRSSEEPIERAVETKGEGE